MADQINRAASSISLNTALERTTEAVRCHFYWHRSFQRHLSGAATFTRAWLRVADQPKNALPTDADSDGMIAAVTFPDYFDPHTATVQYQSDGNVTFHSSSTDQGGRPFRPMALVSMT